MKRDRATSKGHHCCSWAHPSSEPMKSSSDKCLTLKMCFLLALASAKMVNELHGLSYQVKHSRDWICSTFSFMPSFVAKTQNPTLQDTHFNEFMISSFTDLVDGDGEEILLCFIRTIKHYLPGLNSIILPTSASLFLQKIKVFIKQTISWSVSSEA